MARFVSSRHGSEALAPVQVRIGAETSSGPVAEAAAVDTTFFDSSWDLRRGLEVAELEALPEDLPPATPAPRDAPERP